MVKVLATHQAQRPKFNSKDPHDGRRGLTPSRCPLTPTHAYTHTQQSHFQTGQIEVDVGLRLEHFFGFVFVFETRSQCSPYCPGTLHPSVGTKGAAWPGAVLEFKASLGCQ